MSGKAEDGLDRYVGILDRFAEVESLERDQASEMEQEFRELATVAQTLRTALSAVSRPIPSRNINRTPFESAGQARAWIHSASTSMRDGVTFAQLASRVVDALVDPPPIDRMGVHPVPADDAGTAHRLRMEALDELVRDAPAAVRTLQALEGFLNKLTRRRDAVCASLTDERLEIAQRLPGALYSLRLSQPTVQIWANALQTRLGQLRQAVHAWDDVTVQRLAEEIEGIHERLRAVSRKVAGVGLPPAIEKMGNHRVPTDRLAEFDRARERIFAEVAAGGAGNEAIDAIVGIVRELSVKHARITATLTEKVLRLAQRVGALARQDCGTVGRVRAWQGKAQRCVGALRPAVHAWDSASVERISAEINALSASGRQLRKELSIEAETMKSEAQRLECVIAGMVATLKRTREYGGLLPRLKTGLQMGSLAAAGVAIALLVGLSVAGIKEHFLLTALVGSAAGGVGVGWWRAVRISVDVEKQIEVQENAIGQLQREREKLLADLSPLEAVLRWFAP